MVRFLIVDDAPFIREILKNLLISLGAVCVGEAEDGQEGIEMFKKNLPDLVILDLVMPQKNGLEAAEEMKKIWSESVIVACTTVDQKALLDRALSSGCDACLSKPFSKKDLQRIMKDFFPKFKEAQR